MTEATRDLVVLITHGADHELSSVAFTIANGGLTAGLQVSIFLTSAAVDLVRKRAIDMTHVGPLEPLASMVKDFLARGGQLWACTPCVRARGYEQGASSTASRSLARARCTSGSRLVAPRSASEPLDSPLEDTVMTAAPSVAFDANDLETRVKAMYRRVAEDPHGEFHFEMGRALAERLGYPPVDLNHIPPEAIESFAGVGYHFDLAEVKGGRNDRRSRQWLRDGHVRRGVQGQVWGQSNRRRHDR